MDHYRPDDDLSDRSKLVVIITISKYSPVKDVLVFFIYEDCLFQGLHVKTVYFRGYM